MSHFNLSIQMDNAAFDEYPGSAVDEVKRILQTAIDAMQDRARNGYPATGALRDLNGNTVGTWLFGADGVPIAIHGDDAAVVAVGTPVTGLQFIGPFPSHWEAEQFCEATDFGDDDTYTVAPLARGL